MRYLIALLCAPLLILSACEPTSPDRPASSGDGPTVSQDRVQIYAAVIRQLVTKDHTFGRGTSPFKHVYVVDGEIENVEKGALSSPPEPFSEELKQGLEERLSDLPPMDFLSDPDDVRVGPQGLGGVENDGVIISLGPIERENDEIHVSNGLWCGGLCGQWLTYVLQEGDDGWKITGTTGPAAIS